MIKTENFAQVEVTSVAELQAWLEANHAQQASIWLITYKKHTGARYVSRSEVIDALLCFGWIDGIARKLDDERTMQLVSPRRVAHWARSYKQRAARLIAEGRMHPAGVAAIAESKRLGLWEAMDEVDDLTIPDDLRAALEARPEVAERFAASAPSYRRNVLRWIKLAKTPTTRTKRIEQTALLTAQNQKVPQM